MCQMQTATTITDSIVTANRLQLSNGVSIQVQQLLIPIMKYIIYPLRPQTEPQMPLMKYLLLNLIQHWIRDI